ncbi:MAG: hypothetical protein KGL39_40210 [Patescibacteria group bacterium]|nr:hypothetical protein [Patescibacteria group bacterium]
MNTRRIIVWVSAGEASAVAWKLAFQEFGNRVIGVYCDTSTSESPDNKRFLDAVSKWVGQPLTIIRSKKFTNVDEVIEARHYLAGQKGAPCTVELKKVPRFHFQEADDIHVWGFTSDEKKRIKNFRANNPDMLLDFILQRHQVDRKTCTAMIVSAGIERPLRYRQGYANNNCICCNKAQSFQYWVMERRNNPEVFSRRAAQSRKFGARLTRYGGKRIFIDELPPDDKLMLRGKSYKVVKSEEKISCGPECGTI